MDRSLPFFLVDVFAEASLTGNPLAVVADADDVDEDVMRAIAKEFNQSETTFVLASTREGVDWRLRSFTPAGARSAARDTTRSGPGGGSPPVAWRSMTVAVATPRRSADASCRSR
jgi:hypothetical protein